MTRSVPRRTFVIVAKIASAALILGLLISWQPLDTYADVWRGLAPGPVILAYALLFPMVLLRANQAQRLARHQGIEVGLRPFVSLQLATSFYGLFLPGVVATGVLRWYRLTKLGGSPAAMLALITFSRIIEIEVTLALGLVFWLLDGSAPAGPLVPGIVGALLVSVHLGRLAIFNPRTAAWIEGHIRRRWSEARAPRARKQLLDLLEATGRYGDLALGAWTGLLMTALGGQVLGLVSLVLLGGAVGLDAGLATFGWARALLQLALLMPLAWGGIGLREATLAGALTFAGHPAAAAVTVGLLLSLRGLLEAALGGLVELRSWLVTAPTRESVPP